MMKKLLLAFTVMAILLGSCSKDKFRSDLDDSLDTWLKFRKANNNSYSYTVTNSSWTGFSSTTTLVIINGSVSERIYRQYSINGATGVKTLVKSWSEDKISLKSHAEGAEILTLDNVCAKAKNEWLKADKNENTVYLETKNDGMISSCGFVPKNCMDDCFNGINISQIKPLVNGQYVARSGGLTLMLPVIFNNFPIAVYLQPSCIPIA